MPALITAGMGKDVVFIIYRDSSVNEPLKTTLFKEPKQSRVFPESQPQAGVTVHPQVFRKQVLPLLQGGQEGPVSPGGGTPGC